MQILAGQRILVVPTVVDKSDMHAVVSRIVGIATGPDHVFTIRGEVYAEFEVGRIVGILPKIPGGDLQTLGPGVG